VSAWGTAPSEDHRAPHALVRIVDGLSSYLDAPEPGVTRILARLTVRVFAGGFDRSRLSSASASVRSTFF
jgi:hypothetical protein